MQFSDQFIAILNAICAKLGVVIDWTVANVVPYLQDLVRRVILWQVAQRSVWLIFVVCSAIASVISANKLRKKCIKEWDEFDPCDPLGAFSIVLYIVAFILAIVTFGIIAGIVQIVFVPEVWFIQFAQGFLASH